jgi:hypothetical protein
MVARDSLVLGVLRLAGGPGRARDARCSTATAKAGYIAAVDLSVGGINCSREVFSWLLESRRI